MVWMYLQEGDGLYHICSTCSLLQVILLRDSFSGFIDIVSYLQFFMVETVSMAELQRYEVNASKVKKRK